MKWCLVLKLTTSLVATKISKNESFIITHYLSNCDPALATYTATTVVKSDIIQWKNGQWKHDCRLAQRADVCLWTVGPTRAIRPLVKVHVTSRSGHFTQHVNSVAHARLDWLLYSFISCLQAVLYAARDNENGNGGQILRRENSKYINWQWPFLYNINQSKVLKR